MASSKKPKTSFEENILKTIEFLEKENANYFILGGLAVSVLGEPRFTYDLDLDIFLKKSEIASFLKEAKKKRFQCNTKEALEHVKQFGTFRFFLKNLQIDIILASTELEQSALKRRQQISLFGKKMWFPSVEDLLLLKLVPGRPKDLMDAESIVLRHRKGLDIRYLENWTRQIADEAENYQIVHRLQSLLKAV